ncbi:MAG: 7-dehydrocholesterol reductase [Chitinophagales bacterium]|nr:MAG: 7-dehydrocholesterol reductase [Chitinophagales bacterium]
MQDWATTKSNFFTRTLVPLFLVLVCPPFAIVMWYTNVYLDGSFLRLGEELWTKGPFSFLYEAWAPVFWGSAVAWKMIAVFAALQLALMRLLPGKKYQGPVTANGNIPEYRDNGLASYLITFALFLFCSLHLKWFSPGIIYHHFGELLGALNILALLLCVLLYFKGRYVPSTSDHSSTGNFVFDFYWGTELYPRILGWDVKQFTNCRFGMTGWALCVVSFAFAQKEIHGAADWGIIVSASIICTYLFKFFIWEPGYMRSMDIQVDRAGFYICWGCLVWVPAVYTSPVLFMVNHPAGLSLPVAGILFLAGMAAIGINYWADRQRQIVRATNGNTLIWGRSPMLIEAQYTTARGEVKTNLLLASGFWGISRHFHYVPEILAAFLWSCPAGFRYFMPYFYVSFLTILLTHRAFRDDHKCRLKYGTRWEEYCRLVPYRIIPGVI